MSTPNLSQISDDVKARFWARVERCGSEECWSWTGGLSGRGYGEIWVDGKKVIASRLSWMIGNGRTIPAGLFVCHTCDNPKCVNPAHLFVGTQSENINDAARKGRLVVPVKSHLTESDVREMRQLRAAGATQRDLCSRFKLHRSSFYRIVTGQRWKHVA